MARRVETDYWQFSLTPEQVDTLRLVLTFARSQVAFFSDTIEVRFAKNVARARIDSLIDEINSVTG